MQIFLAITFLFFIGSSLGWVLEVLFRRFFSAKKWINPGFLTGPYLPLYGFGLIGAFGLSMIDLSFVNNTILEIILRVVLIIFSMTLIEYLTGIIFIKGMNIKLWDYSDRKGNIQGIICPLFSLFWGIIGTGYYYLLHPLVLKALEWYLFDNLAYSFVVGMFYGIMLIDFCNAISLSTKIRKFAKENIMVVKYEELKLSIRKYVEEKKEKVYYWKPFKSSMTLKEAISKYKQQKEEKLNNKENSDEHI